WRRPQTGGNPLRPVASVGACRPRTVAGDGRQGLPRLTSRTDRRPASPPAADWDVVPPYQRHMALPDPPASVRALPDGPRAWGARLRTRTRCRVHSVQPGLRGDGWQLRTRVPGTSLRRAAGCCASDGTRSTSTAGWWRLPARRKPGG